MNEDPDEKFHDATDSVLERIKAETKRRGIDTTCKTMAEIQKLLSGLPD